MSDESEPEEDLSRLPVALRNQQITEEDFATLVRIAEDPNPASGKLNWTPKRIPLRGSTDAERKGA